MIKLNAVLGRRRLSHIIHAYLIVAATTALLTFGWSSAEGQVTGLNTTTGILRAKAQADECFSSIGSNLPFTKPPCFFGQPKVNQGYIWAMTEANNEIWFGTVANPQCITEGGLSATAPTPYQTPSWVCEFGKSAYAALLPAQFGDFRPSQVFVYNKTTHSLTDLTPKAPVSASNPLGIDPIMYTTLGLRAAVTIGDLVLLAGQALSVTPGLNFLAFRASDHAYLGSVTLPNYDSIRQFTTYNGQVYTAVGKGLNGGSVLKYTGAIGPAPCTSCVQFDVVGDLDGSGAYIAAHQNRLFVSTWPDGQVTSLASLYMSPVVPNTGGLPTSSSWTKVWDATNYEPDRVIAASYAAGALASFDGYLYWGTMHVPWSATGVFLSVYGAPTTTQDWANAVIGTFRTATIFRGRNFDTIPDVQLLYGSPVLESYTPPFGNIPGKWQLVDNHMPAGKKNPLYGPPGFGNPYNNYTWSMSVWDNRLWIGTMDWGHPAQQGTLAIYSGLNQTVPPEVTAFFGLQVFGADLFFLQSSQSPAVPETLSGVGNYTSYGVRNMVPSSNLFLGMANPSNLLTNPAGPLGGWELIELQKTPGSVPLNLLTGFTCSPNTITGPGSTTCTVTISQPATFGLNVGLVPIAPPGVTLNAPLTFPVVPGATSAAVTVTATEPTASTNVLLLAGLNGGSWVAPLTLNPGVPKISGAILAKGLQSPGLEYVDLKLTNTGTGNAQQLTLSQIGLQTLTGTGTVALAVPSPALPIVLSDLAVGASTTVRLYFSLPATVSRFSITESGTVQSASGTIYSFSNAQTVFP